MAPSSRPDYKLNLDGLGPLNMGQQTRSANTSATNSPIEAPAGLRYPLGNGLGNGNGQAGPGRAGAGSPSKEYGSRLFPKRSVVEYQTFDDCLLIRNSGHVRFRLKRGCLLRSGVHPPLAVDTPPRCARRFRSRLAAIASRTSKPHKQQPVLRQHPRPRVPLVAQELEPFLPASHQ